MINSPFECPICFENFDDASYLPCTLPCGHSCCISHVSVLNICCTCKEPIPHHVNIRPSYSLRDGAILYKDLFERYELSKSIDCNSTSIPSSLSFPEEIEAERSLISDEEYARMINEQINGPGIPVYDPADEDFARKLQLELDEERSLHNRLISASIACNENTDIPIPAPPPLVVRSASSDLSCSPPRAGTVTRINSGRNSQVKDCGHRCWPSFLPNCCTCSDKRPLLDEGTYPMYKDGIGWVNEANRNAGYCPNCV